jgi:hypothetical protein
MNSLGIAGFDATSTNASNGATFSISAATGAAVFKGSIQSGSTISGTAITGSSFQSTNYAAGRGVAITSSGGGDNIGFTFGGSSVADITVVSGGLIISAGAALTPASITMTSAGNISIASTNNTLVMSTSPYFSGGSGGNTSGGVGTIRNTWAALSDPSGGDPGDVWLKYT